MKATSELIVEEAIEGSGQINLLNEELKSLLILIVEAGIRRGYVDGYKDSKQGLDQKTTEEDIIKFKELYAKIKK